MTGFLIETCALTDIISLTETASLTVTTFLTETDSLSETTSLTAHWRSSELLWSQGSKTGYGAGGDNYKYFTVTKTVSKTS